MSSPSSSLFSTCGERGAESEDDQDQIGITATRSRTCSWLEEGRSSEGVGRAGSTSELSGSSCTARAPRRPLCTQGPKDAFQSKRAKIQQRSLTLGRWIGARGKRSKAGNTPSSTCKQKFGFLAPALVKKKTYKTHRKETGQHLTQHLTQPAQARVTAQNAVKNSNFLHSAIMAESKVFEASGWF